MKIKLAVLVFTVVFALAGDASAVSMQTRKVGSFPQKAATQFPLAGEAAGATLQALSMVDGPVIATDQGVFRLDPITGAWQKTGDPGPAPTAGTLAIPPSIKATPPVNDLLAVAERGGKALIGTTMGAAYFNGTRWEYFQGREYLADDRVVAVTFGVGDDLWLGSIKGVTRIEYVPITLAEKAAKMEAATRARHLRYGLVSDSDLKIPGDLAANVTATSDNDGLWTAMYIGAEAYRFAVTRDPEARAFARQSLEALMFLQTVTEIPGFVARSFARPDDPHDNGEWNHLYSDGQWRWKGDTSSDEIDGHFYAYALYYDLVADEKEKEEIRSKVRLITDYIIDNNFYLLDTDGKPTTWGHWNYLGIRRFLPSRGLNGLEILSHLKVAHHITGDDRYRRVYYELALKHDYARFTVNQKYVFPPSAVNHSDDELAFLSYYPLLKYETDPQLLHYYHRSFTRSYRIEEPEKIPLWNFIYGAVMPAGTPWDLDGAIDTLKLISLNLVRWDHRNSRRRDVKIKVFRGRFKEMESVVPLPPDERTVMKWNGNPYRLDTGGKGMSEEAGTFWLLPYWMGRYYGFIVEE
jgi:hypothetical protein